MAQDLFVPGEEVADISDQLRGHGITTNDTHLVSSLCGISSQLHKLTFMTSFKTWYQPRVGDIVIGRIVSIEGRKWKVDVGAPQHGRLMISSVNLPGGELRRRDQTDELNMRSFFIEGDVLSAEVQQTNQDGSFTLHTRSERYGKLEHGYFARTESYLVKRANRHIHTLDNGVGLIIGVNGRCWISGPRPMAAGQGESTKDMADAVLSVDRLRGVARTARAIEELTAERKFVTLESITARLADM
ncbi:exosome subunit Rrp4 [Carpediemonas membranifera]|uniref:Exosome subunit Rrp4 n=1 Tax=Carpediemonas membranifera TaxID=201153 RepID=A0A8J6ASC6_9EUKA|nr:exosome subunit Rrp4 [Carpediemonas membranifera]|eukprot:KAG9393226.1 exosome subunit Rrp4 [Carpediemonas membranifera]